MSLLEGFVRRWALERPPRRAGQFAAGGERSGVEFVAAVDWLASAAGVERHDIENLMRRRTRTTELRIADPLVAAIGAPQALYDGTLDVRPNPRASARARSACCGGGSLTGSGGRR